VWRKRREVVVALLAAGADANVKNKFGETAVSWAAYDSTADILQLLIDVGGSVNKPDVDGRPPLITSVRMNLGDLAARLCVLMPELDLDVTYEGKTAEKWAEEDGCPDSGGDWARASEADAMGRPSFCLDCRKRYPLQK
jgi:ankyrin repeat protein